MPSVTGMGLPVASLTPGTLSAAVGVSERAGEAFIRFLDFYCGVFSLVSVSLAVMGGVVAMDRIVLQPRHRMQMQLLHRAVAMASVGFLAVHVTLRVIGGHVSALDIAVPFLAGGRTVFIGLGTVAAQLMIVLAATGIARGRFAYLSRPALWRSIHATAYLCWPIALVHGLQAGRSPKPWVTLSYGACVALVVAALLVRAVTSRRQKAQGKKDVRTTKEVRLPRQGGARMRPVGTSSGAAPQAVATNTPRVPAVALNPPRRPGPARVAGPVATSISDDDFWDYLRSPEPGGMGPGGLR
jgi:DMSO/TMAO reductase YedYZ heme-binding membrane subunit